MAIDTGTAVPAAVGLFTIVYLYDNLIFAFVLIKIRCYINGERRVAIVMLSGLDPIDEHFSFLIHTLKMQFH